MSCRVEYAPLSVASMPSPVSVFTRQRLRTSTCARRRVHAVVRWRTAAVLCALLSAACYGAKASTRASASAVKPLLIKALPAKATFAWVRPTQLLADGTAEDNERAGMGAVHSMRLDVEAVWRGEGWTSVPADSADFQATMTIVLRTRFDTSTRQAQSTTPYTRPCDISRQRCPPQVPQRLETVVVPITYEQAVFALRRVSDGARFERRVGYQGTKITGGVFAKDAVVLMANSRRPSR